MTGIVAPAVTAVDVAPDLLTVSFVPEARDAVAHLDAVLATGGHQALALPVRLAVLAASHQVILGAAASPVLVETVACDAGGQPLERAEPPVGVDFTTRRHHLDDDGAVRFRRRAEEAARSGTDLVVAFPGEAAALTWLALEDGGWRTFHGYPTASGATVVETRTVLLDLGGER